MFDTHTHTKNSPDSVQSIDDLCSFAIKNGISAVSITDHADSESFEENNAFERIKQSLKDASYAAEKYKDKLSVYKGVEISGFTHDREKTENFLKSFDFDIIIASVHRTDYKAINDFYSQIKFSKYNEEYLFDFLSKYFEDVKYVAENIDFDVLGHLSCPLRYISEKYKKSLSLDDFVPYVDEILDVLISRNKALELNTSGASFGFFMPDKKVISRFFQKGGRLITLGSDAHRPENVGNCFNEAKNILKEIGFERYCYYEKRVLQYAKL